MNIELKNLKYFAAGSEETHCFRATVYVDGRKVGEASNEGHGGQTHVQVPADVYAAITAHAKAIPDIGDFEPAEYFIDRLVTDALIERDLKRSLSKKLVYTVASGEIYETKAIPNLTAEIAKGEAVQRAKMAKFKNQPVQILNFLPLPEAIALYRRAADATVA